MPPLRHFLQAAILILLFALAACGQPAASLTIQPSITPSPAPPTPTLPPTSTPTPVPTATITPSPTPVALAYEPIGAQNIDRLTRIKSLGYGNVLETRYLADGSQIALLSTTRSCRLDSASLQEIICVEHPISGSRVAGLDPSSGRVTLSKDGRVLVTSNASEDLFRVWDFQTGQALTTIERAQTLSWNPLLLSPDGSQFLYLPYDAPTQSYGLELWSVEDGRQIAAYPPIKGYFRGQPFSSDGKLLAIPVGLSLQLVNPLDGALISEIQLSAEASGASFSPDRHLITVMTGLTTDRKLHVYRVADGEHLWMLSQAALSTFSPDGSLLATATQGSRSITLWETETWQPVITLQSQVRSGFSDIQFSPDGALLTGTYAAPDALGNFPDRDVYLWRLSDGELLLKTTGYAMGSLTSFSADGSRLAVASRYELTVWDTATQQRLQTLPIGCAYEPTFSPDGALLAVGCTGGQVALWSTQEGRLERVLGEADLSLQGKYGFPTATELIEFSRDGKMLASSNYDGDRIRVWRVADGAQLNEFALQQYPPEEVEFSDDGRLFSALAYNRAFLWDLASGDLLLIAPITHIGVGSLDFSPDNDLLAVSHVAWKIDTCPDNTRAPQAAPGCGEVTETSDQWVIVWPWQSEPPEWGLFHFNDAFQAVYQAHMPPDQVDYDRLLSPDQKLIVSPYPQVNLIQFFTIKPPALIREMNTVQAAGFALSPDMTLFVSANSQGVDLWGIR